MNINITLLRNIAYVSLIIFLIMLMNDSGGDDGGIGSLSKLFVALSFSLLVVILLLGEKYRSISAFHIITLMYFFWFMLSLGWSAAQDEKSMEIISDSIQIMIIILVLWQLLYNKVTLIWFYQGYVLGALLVCIQLINTFLSGTIQVVEGQEMRITFKGVDHNQIAVLICFAIPMAILIFSRTKKLWIKIFNFTYIPVGMIAVLLTASRMGSVLLVLSLSYFLFNLNRITKPWKIILISGFISIAIFALSFIPKSSLDRLMTTSNSISKGTLNGRSVAWEKALEEWKVQPTIGTGLNSFLFNINKHHLAIVAHNVYISILVEQGIIGIILYLSIIISLIFCMLGLKIEDSVFIFIILVTSLLSQSALNLHTGILHWIIYALISIHKSIYNKKQQRVINNEKNRVCYI